MRVLSLPLTLGRADRVDPKFAPLGVLAVAKNLRIRKDGRLVCRNGYAPLATTTTLGGTLAAYDLHEYQGRLLALATDIGDSSPTDIFEYINLPSAAWRASNANLSTTLTPFTNPHEVAGISQIGDGVSSMTTACGSGFSALAWRPSSTTDIYVMIVRQSDGQLIHHEKVTTAGFSVCMTFASGVCYIQLALFSGDVSILQFTPGTSLAFSAFATPVVGGGIAVHDLTVVTNATTARVVSAISKVGSTTTRVYNSAGTQLGSTATAAITAITLSVDADQTDNTTNLYTVTGTNTGQLRTFNSTTGAQTIGPTTTTVGASGAICRNVPILGGLPPACIAVIVNDANSNVVLQFFSQAAHGASSTTTVQRAFARSRPVAAQFNGLKRGVVFAGIVAPALPVLTDPVSGSSTATNALFYVGDLLNTHMSTRDATNAVDPSTLIASGVTQNLQLDSSTGKLTWGCMRNTALALGGQNLGQPAVTLVDFQSAARRQSAQYGGLLYLTGATVGAYDGCFLAELNFNELPGFYSATPAAGGALAASALYSYVHHWEYTRADGSLEQSAPSAVFPANTGGAQTQNTLVVSTPHSVRVALGGSLFGGSVVSVISRTVWDPLNAVQGSVFRRCVVKQVPLGMANYGAPLTILDQVSDTFLSTQAVVYTQGERGELSGPVENDAPEGCSYASSSSARIVLGGLVRGYEFVESKEAFLDEPINFSELSSFYGKVSKQINGVMSLDGVRLIFTRDQIYAVAGVGVNDIGGGRLPPAIEIPAASGLEDWRSLLKAPDGIYFQLDDNKIYTMPRGAGVPVWAGIDVQDTLAAFPVVTGACLQRRDDVAAFSCQNVAGTDARLVVRSLRTGLWIEDSPPLSGSNGIRSIVGVGDSLAYISGTTVFLQSTTSFTDGASSVIVTQTKTHPIYPFELGGYGTLHGVLLTGEFRSAGTLALRVSYDDGISFVVYDSFVLSGLAVGQTVQRKWALQQSDLTSVVFEWTFTPSAPSEGFICHSAALLADPVTGQLKELDPSEMA